jgi:solute carrier family 15 (peptide/histidine transporter), member 3/4
VLTWIPYHCSFLDKAAIVTTADLSSGSINPWMLCTVSHVEELKSILRLLPIWSTFIVFSVVCSQESSVFVEQGMVMDRRIGSSMIPAASLSSFDVLAVFIFAPMYEKIIKPISCRFTKTEGGLTVLQRAGIGFIFSILAISSAAIIEARRLQIVRDEGVVHGTVAVPMSIFWQIPQYVLLGVAEVFSQISLLEFFYDEAPHSLRSLCMALALLTLSLGSYVNSFMITVVSRVTGWIPDNLNEGHLDHFFWFVAGISLFNLVVFTCVSRYRYKRK